MPSGVGLEAVFSTKGFVTKRRTSRRSVARSFYGLSKLGNSINSKRVGDSSWADSDKDSVSPHVCSSLLLGDQGQLLFSPDQRFSNRRGHGTEETPKAKLVEGYRAKREYKDEGDFSGIELLATAASMEVDVSANNQDLVIEDSLTPKDSDPSGSATPAKACLKINEPENSSIDITAHGGNSSCSSVLGNSTTASRSLCSSAEDVTKPKVNRQHWDLNTLMDAWEEQYDDTIAGNSTNYVNIEETKLNTVLPDGEKHLGEPLSRPFSLLMSEEEFKSTDTVMKMPIEDYSSNVRESDEKISVSDRTLDVTPQDMSTSEIPRSPINVRCKENRDSRKAPELHGTFTRDGQLVLMDDLVSQDDGKCLSSSTITDSRVQLGLVAPTAKREDINLAIESTDVTENLSKNCSAGKMGPPDLAVIQNDRANMVGGGLPESHEEGYDSPYEDGELRGSFLYSWEDNEIENERVDYESDGRNGDGPDGADYPGIDIAGGGGPEGFHSLSVKDFTGEKSKGELGSLRVQVNNDNMKGSQLIARRDEYAPKTPSGKLHSRMEGWSSMDATDGKDGYFMQQCRARRFGSYPRPDGDINISPPDHYMGRFKPATYTQNEGERDRISRFTSSRGRCNYSTRYQGPENRTQYRPRKTVNNPPKGIQIRPPFMRRSPPIERDEHFFTPRRRMLPEHGAGNYRDRGRFSNGRNFRDDHDFGPPLPDDDDAGFLSPVRMRRYMSNREHSFSPPIFRNPHMPFLPPPRISRSRSRSRTQSPRSKFRSRRFGVSRRNNRSRSPEFRHESRMHKMRMMRNFSRPEYGDGFSVSPQRSYVQGRRSPVRVLRHGGNTKQSFDGNLRKGFRPFTNPRRFSNYDGGRRRRDDGGKLGDFEAVEFSNNENDDVLIDDVEGK